MFCLHGDGEDLDSWFLLSGKQTCEEVLLILWLWS